MKLSRTWMSWRRFGTAFAASLGLVAAGVPVSQALAAQVTVGSTSCTYSAFNGDTNGNFTFTCESTSSPGTLAFTSTSASLAPSASTNVAVNRTGGSTGAVSATVSVTSGSCTASPGTVNFADGSTAQEIVTVTASAVAPSSCVVALSAATGGATLGAAKNFTVSVVDPNANVTFKFSSPTSNAGLGGGATSITVTRSGGTNGDWDVPFTLAGSLTASGNLVTGGGSVSPSTGILNFPAGTQSKNITYTPPASLPAGVTAPGTVVFTLGGPNPIAPATGQTGSLVTPTDHTVSVVQDTVCTTSATKEFTYPNTQYKVVGVKPGETAAVGLNIGPTTLGSDLYGKWTMLESTATGDKTDVQFSISACPGDFEPASANCIRHTGYTGGYINWGVGTPPASWALWLRNSACMLPAGTTKVYFNFRQVKKPALGSTLPDPPIPSCTVSSGCPPIVVHN